MHRLRVIGGAGLVALGIACAPRVPSQSAGPALMEASGSAVSDDDRAGDTVAAPLGEPTAPGGDMLGDIDLNLLSQLAASARSCAERQDADHIVFHGCYDWHSSVHAHWAMLRAGRVTGAQEQIDWVDAALDPDLVEQERAYLAARPGFEMPYGRAWFLALALEHHAVTGRTTLDVMARDVAASLRGHYTRQAPSPTSREYANASWALTWLYRYYVATGDDDGARWVEDTVRTHLAAADASIDPSRDFAAWPDFFSVWGNQAQVLWVVLGDEAVADWLAEAPVDSADLATVEGAHNAHHLGMNPSRAWAMWTLYRATGESRFADAWRAHVDAAARQFEEHSSDYRAYGHWVPQFAIYALTAPLFDRMGVPVEVAGD